VYQQHSTAKTGLSWKCEDDDDERAFLIVEEAEC
jgi:hypothetical protein